MQINVLLFGPLVDVVGASQLEMNNVKDLETLRSSLFERYSELRDQKFVIAINKQISNGNPVLKDQDNVALLPPFAGG